MNLPRPSAVLELFKPITWFPPMWAFACGVASSPAPVAGHLHTLLLGVLLTGPLVCATSQVINDWFDRHVDAINEPQRPIPSGRIPGTWGFWLGVGWTLLSLLIGLALGPWGFAATCLGLLLAWLYSAPPVRLKQNGWWGNTACGLCYEGLPWITGAALVSANGQPSLHAVMIALLYSAGAHGIMTLNDFKSMEGDRIHGIRSLPVQLGARWAGQCACLVMTLPQLVVLALLLRWNAAQHAVAIGLLLASQLVLMGQWLRHPRALAPWYQGTGVTLYVLGMLISAYALAAQPITGHVT